MTITTRVVIEFCSALTMMIGISGFVWNRIRTNKGIGVRGVQFVTLTTILPMILILSLEGVIDGCTTSAIIGSLIGYIFSNIAQYDLKNKGNDDDA